MTPHEYHCQSSRHCLSCYTLICIFPPFFFWNSALLLGPNMPPPQANNTMTVIPTGHMCMEWLNGTTGTQDASSTQPFPSTATHQHQLQIASQPTTQIFPANLSDTSPNPSNLATNLSNLSHSTSQVFFKPTHQIFLSTSPLFIVHTQTAKQTNKPNN